MYLLAKKIDGLNKVRCSIGGYPVLPSGYQWPECPKSSKKMVLFLQVDLPGDIGLGEGMHLSIFMSPEINEIPSFEFIPKGGRLPPNFIDKREKHFKAYIFKGNGVVSDENDQYLVYQQLEISEFGSSTDIKIGGEPDWLQDPEVPIGPNGEEFKFVLQIPEGYGFPKKPGAPEQPDSFSYNDYCLFLGNQIYVFASKEMDDPESVWIVVQN
jgi:hypothetical protein